MCSECGLSLVLVLRAHRTGGSRFRLAEQRASRAEQGPTDSVGAGPVYSGPVYGSTHPGCDVAGLGCLAVASI
jgi:hypothetical protein